MPVSTRRAFLSGLSSLALAATAGGALAQSARPLSIQPRGRGSGAGGEAARYGAVAGEPFPVPAVDLRRIDPAYLRRVVDYDGAETPGTIVIDPNTRYLYLVEEGGRAIRYGVGVGREGFGWSGTATIKNKQEWPDWYPPKEMIARQPEIRRQMSQLQSGIGMPGGPRNPLGARAMYLWQNNKDTLYRIHGTVEPWTIGKRVSSGCIRMINQDAMDLYERVPIGTTVVVLGSGRGDEVASRKRRPRKANEDLVRQEADPYGPEEAYEPQPSRWSSRRRRGVYDPYGQGAPVDPYAGPYGYDAGSNYRLPPDDGRTW